MVASSRVLHTVQCAVAVFVCVACLLDVHVFGQCVYDSLRVSLCDPPHIKSNHGVNFSQILELETQPSALLVQKYVVVALHALLLDLVAKNLSILPKHLRGDVMR